MPHPDRLENYVLHSALTQLISPSLSPSLLGWKSRKMSFGFNIQNVIWWKSLFGRFHLQIRLILSHTDRKSDHHHHRQGLTNDEYGDEEINGASPGNGGLRIVPGAVTFQNTEAMTKVRKGLMIGLVLVIY